MAYEIGRRALRSVTKHPLVYGTAFGIAFGLTGGNLAYRTMDAIHVKPRAAFVENNNRLADALEKITDNYYGLRQAGQTLTFNLSPGIVLSKLQETKKIVDDSRQILKESGYLGKLKEDQLETTIRNVQSFAPSWPQNARDWYTYLYAGDAEWRPRARELESFYTAARETQRELRNTYTGRVLRNMSSLFAGLLTTIGFWRSYPRIDAALENWHRRLASKRRLDEKMEKLRRAYPAE